MPRSGLRFKQIRTLYSVLFGLWGIGFLMLHLSENGISLKHLFQYSTAIDSKTIKRLMLRPGYVNRHSNNTVLTPLEQIYVDKANTLHFYDLPKLKTFATYTEVTSANRDTRFPLAPDFTFHLKYELNRVKLYEDVGPGCIFRIYLFPPLPTDTEAIYKMTSKDLVNKSLRIIIDDVAYRYSIQQVMDGKVPPFVSPLSTEHPTPASGMGAYTPFCYQSAATVYYEHDGTFPEDLFQRTVNCTANELTCPVKLYSSISRHKYMPETKVESFQNTEPQLTTIANIAALLKNPESHGPDSGSPCVLECAELCAKCQRVVYHRIRSAGVISSMKFRVFQSGTDQPAVDWNEVFLSAYFDVDGTPQVDRIPLGSLFGASGSLNDFNGAMYGRRSKYCSYSEISNLPTTTTTGYFYLPMPYWEEALVILEGSEYLRDPLTVCYQVLGSKNHYHENDTGYLHASKSYYTDDASGWRSVVDVSGGWGHVVAVGMEIDNLRAIRNVPLAYRWAVLQADNMIYVDGVKSPTVMGTGLEDYFSYAHGFSQAENTSYAFVGVYHASPKRKEPLTWHCYRQHVLDPIPFRSALRFVMEGTDASKFTTPVPPLDYRSYRLRKLDDQPVISHLALYYFRPYLEDHSLLDTCDRILLSNYSSENTHSFKMATFNRKHTSGKFCIHERHFIGDSVHNQTQSGCGRTFAAGDEYQFVLNVSSSGEGKELILRRTFHSKLYHWNDYVGVSINYVYAGTLSSPMGPLSAEYSLRQEDLVLPHDLMRLAKQNGRFVAQITIQPRNVIRDLSYELCFI